MATLGLSVVDNGQVAKRFDVVAIGNALVDVLTPVASSFLIDNGLARGTMRLIDEAQADALYLAMCESNSKGAREMPGGSAASTAVGVVSCGGRAAFLGTLADDGLGQVFSDDLKRAGVHDGTDKVETAGTGRSLILIEPDGERTMNTFLGASSEVVVKPHHAAMLSAAKIVFIEAYLFDSNFTVESVVALGEFVRQNGGRVAITLSDALCVERHREELLEALEHGVDVCLGNDRELKALFQTGDLGAAISSASPLVEVVVATRGARGSVIAQGGLRYEIPALPVEVVDATGAGDLYAAGFLYGLSQGWNLARSGRMGATAAAAVLTQVGGRVEVPISESSISPAQIGSSAH